MCHSDRILDNRYKLDEIVEDDASYSREKLDWLVVDEYVEVIRLGGGSGFPPIVLDRATMGQPKMTLLDGRHRVSAFRPYGHKHSKFGEDYEKELKRRTEEGLPQDEPALTPPPPPVDAIPCKFVDVPKNIPRILFSYGFNRRHGLRPKPQDRIKTAKAAYLANRGIPL
jgi:hypothetical protein